MFEIETPCQARKSKVKKEKNQSQAVQTDPEHEPIMYVFFCKNKFLNCKALI